MSDIRRQTAYKCSIKQLLDGQYIHQQGLNPNYVNLNGVHASRINILAILVSREGNILTIDDGSGQIQIMLFEDRLKNKNLSLGKLLLIVGKPREHSEKIFLVREMHNRKWMEHRKKELSLLTYCNTPKEPKIEKTEIPEIIENYQEKILKKIKALDQGDGAPYQEVAQSLKMQDIDEKITELIKEGEIFEIKGKLKIL